MKSDKQTEHLFNDEIIDSFNYGDCWVLAVIIKKLIGWNIICVGVEGQSQSGGMREWCHIAVQAPSGHIVDINGVHTPEDFLYDWRVSMWRLKRGIHEVELFISPNYEYDKKILLGQEPKYNFSYQEVEDIAHTLIKHYKSENRKRILSKMKIKRPKFNPNNKIR